MELKDDFNVENGGASNVPHKRKHHTHCCNFLSPFRRMQMNQCPKAKKVVTTETMSHSTESQEADNRINVADQNSISGGKWRRNNRGESGTKNVP